MSEKISDLRLADIIEAHGVYVMPDKGGRAQHRDVESALRELQQTRALLADARLAVDRWMAQSDQQSRILAKAEAELSAARAEVEQMRETGKALVRNAIAMGEATGDEWDRLCDERVELLGKLNGTASSAGGPQS